jgi:hypothetical protein
MATLAEVRKEISDLTGAMIGVGLCVDQNFPSENTYVGEDGSVTELSITGSNEITAALKNRPYVEIYAALAAKRAYNMRLIDGALIQFRYRFNREKLLKHALAFYPSPNLLEYQNAPDIYELDVLYAESIRKDVVTTPIRFDFDDAAFKEIVHPKSHFTIGQYRHCRIAVSNGLTPFRFLHFILRAFYNTPFHELCSEWRPTASDFPESVSELERADLHLSFTAL